MNGFKLYNEGFFDSVKQINMKCAETIVPLVSQYGEIGSVVDFGCGVGCWLRAFSDHLGISDVFGLDGEWLRGNELLIDENRVNYVDLSQPIDLGRKFDLVISLEVAEHIQPEYADVFIRNLTAAGDLILFSAAIPWQGGVGHVNEQWPDYWASKFDAAGFICFDVIRPQCWENVAAGIYRQNIFLFVKKTELSKYPKIQQASPNIPVEMRNIVAPFLYDTLMKKYTSLLDTLMLMAEKESRGATIYSYFKNRKIDTVAIYGMAEFGRTITRYFLNLGIKVECGIDKQQMEPFEGIPIFRPYELAGRKPRIIISTVPNAFETIRQTLDSIDGESELIDINQLIVSL